MRRPRKGALQNPAVLAARALAHARSARWRAVCFPEQATSARLAGGGACGGTAASYPASVVRGPRDPEPLGRLCHGAAARGVGLRLEPKGAQGPGLTSLRKGPRGLRFSRDSVTDTGSLFSTSGRRLASVSLSSGARVNRDFSWIVLFRRVKGNRRKYRSPKGPQCQDVDMEPFLGV